MREHVEERHILMSLLIAKVWKPADGATCLDLGTGGGFPGIPLAIVYPRCGESAFSVFFATRSLTLPTQGAIHSAGLDCQEGQSSF